MELEDIKKIKDTSSIDIMIDEARRSLDDSIERGTLVTNKSFFVDTFTLSFMVFLFDGLKENVFYILPLLLCTISLYYGYRIIQAYSSVSKGIQPSKLMKTEHIDYYDKHYDIDTGLKYNIIQFYNDVIPAAEDSAKQRISLLNEQQHYAVLGAIMYAGTLIVTLIF